MYDTDATIRQGAKMDTDAKVFKAKLLLNWTGPYKVLAVGPCTPAYTPDGSPLGSKLLYMDLPSDMPGADARQRVSGHRCKPCANPYDHGNMPKYLPATQYVVWKKSLPYHVTQNGVSTPLDKLEVEKIIGHQSVRDRGRVIAVMHKTHWTGVSRPSWERETDLHLSRHEILPYWAGTPNQHRQTIRLYRWMRTGAAQRERSRSNGERFLAPGYGCDLHAEWLSRYSATVLPNGAHSWYKGNDGLWWLGKISASTVTDGVYLVLFLDDPGQIKLSLPPARYTTSTGAVRDSWCLQEHLATS